MAAPPIASLYVAVVPTMTGVQGDLTKQLVPQMTGAADKAGAKAGDKASKSFGSKMKANLGSIMTGAFAGAVGAVAAAGVGKQLWDTVVSAGNLEQNLGAADAIFTKYSDKMVKNSEKAAGKVGLSQNAYLEASVTLGAGLKNAGYEGQELIDQTDKLIGRGADLASMFGGTTKDAVDAQSAALRGEFEQMEKYGVTLTAATVEQKALEMGLISAGDEMTDAAKKAATLQLIQDQTTSSAGNFAKETDTLAGKMQIFGAKFDDLKTAIGNKLLPVASGFFGFLLDTALPALESVGSFIMERVIPPIQRFGEFLNNNKTAILSVVGVVGAMVAGFFAVTGAVAAVAGVVGFATTAFAAVRSALVTARIAVMLFNGALLANPIGLVIAAVAGLVAGFVLAYRNIGWFKDGVNAIWAGIKNAASAVVTWFTGTLVPWFQTALTAVGNAFTWLHQNIIVPIWNAIKTIFAVGVGIVMTWIDLWVWVFRNTLAPVFTWLYNSVIVPVWNGIKAAIGAVANWVRDSLIPFFQTAINVLGNVFIWLKDHVITPVWNGIKWVITNAWEGVKAAFYNIKWVIDNVLAPVFRWLKDSVILPVWNGIRNAISGAWNFIRDKVFTPLKDGIQNGVVNAFEKAKTAIANTWNKIQDVVKKPVRFVLETVLQNGLIKNINSVLGKVGVKSRIPNVWPVAGFRKGGYTGNYGKDEVAGVVHGRENVINAEASAAVERTAPGFLASLNKHGAGALQELVGGQHGAAAGGPGGPGAGLWSSLQSAIYSSGVAHLAGNISGVNMGAVARAWNNMSNVKIKRGRGPNQITGRDGNALGNWGYAWTNGQFEVSPAVPGGMRLPVAIHELGHILSLGHDMSGRSIMHPMMQGPTWPGAYDRATMQRVFGGAGKGNAPEGGGGGFFDWIADKLNPVKKFIEGIGNMLSGGLGSGLFPDMITGAVKMITGGITDWVKNTISSSDMAKENGAGALVPTRYDGGGLLGAGTQLVQHGKHLKPDAVFTHQEKMQYQALAEYAQRNKESGALFTNNGTVIAKDGIREIAEEFNRKQAQKESLRSE